MKIAVTYENGQIFQHFGHTENFKIYETDNKQILSEKVIDTNGSGHGALAGMLSALGVEALICGGIGQGAKLALDDAGIKLYSGVSGDADKAVSELINGHLEFGTGSNCNHHDEGHGHDGCGQNGCGHNGCH